MKYYLWLVLLGILVLLIKWWISPPPIKLVTLQTNLGSIVITTYPQSAPKAAENFTTLAKKGRYDQTPFHRIIKGFMIQGGDYEYGDGTGGKSFWGKPFKDEIDPSLSHIRSMVSMANKGPDTNGAQFFIMLRDNARLDGRHTIFGQVVEGMEVVDRIAQIPTDLLDKPLQSVIIEGTTVSLPTQQNQ